VAAGKTRAKADMKSKRGKIVILLAVMALAGGVLVLHHSQAGEMEKSLKADPKLLFANDPNFFRRQAGQQSGQELVVKMTLSVLIVVVLGVAAVYVSKRFLSKIPRLSERDIKIAESISLGPNKTVHLLEVGRRKILVGSTNENITMLGDVTDAMADLSSQETAAEDEEDDQTIC
jgi:flagellar biogenesis protein FliO